MTSATSATNSSARILERIKAAGGPQKADPVQIARELQVDVEAVSATIAGLAKKVVAEAEYGKRDLRGNGAPVLALQVANEFNREKVVPRERPYSALPDLTPDLREFVQTLRASPGWRE